MQFKPDEFGDMVGTFESPVDTLRLRTPEGLYRIRQNKAGRLEIMFEGYTMAGQLSVLPKHSNALELVPREF